MPRLHARASKRYAILLPQESQPRPIRFGTRLRDRQVLRRNYVEGFPAPDDEQRESTLLAKALIRVVTGAMPASQIEGSRTMRQPTDVDRKSTRPNSSHLGISYAVFCLKKKIDETKHLLAVELVGRDHALLLPPCTV